MSPENYLFFAVWICRLAWFCSLLLFALRLLLPSLQKLTSWGKLVQNSDASGLVTSKFVFVSAYVLGAIWNVVVLCTILFLKQYSLLPSVQDLFIYEVLPYSLLFQFQLVRRAYESYFIQRWTIKPTSILNLLLAWSYYIFACTSPIVDIIYENKRVSFTLKFLSTVSFFWASYHQYKCHYILANLRNDKKINTGYSIPYSDWFDYVSSPHYLAEIIIYVSLWVFSGFKLSSTLILLFVICNLVYSAKETHKWYKEKFRESYPNNRKIIIPYLF